MERLLDKSAATRAKQLDRQFLHRKRALLTGDRHRPWFVTASVWLQGSSAWDPAAADAAEGGGFEVGGVREAGSLEVSLVCAHELTCLPLYEPTRCLCIQTQSLHTYPHNVHECTHRGRVPQQAHPCGTPCPWTNPSPRAPSRGSPLKRHGTLKRNSGTIKMPNV